MGARIGANDSLIAAPAPAPLTMMIVGDSFWEGAVAPSAAPSLAQQLADMCGMVLCNLGSGGTGFCAPNPGSGSNNRLNFRDRICPDDAWSALYALTAGTYTISITVNGTTQTTGALAWNATKVVVETALNALSNVTAAGGNLALARGDINTPTLFVGRGLAGFTVAFDTTSATGTIGAPAKWYGDVAQNVPLDGAGNALPFVLLVSGSGNDSTFTDGQVQTAATYIAQQIVLRFPTAIPIFMGLMGDAVVGNAGTIGAGDLSRNAAIAAAAAYLPKINGRVPVIDTYFAGSGGNKLLYGSGSIAAPTSGTTDVYKSLAQAGHPDGFGAGYLASWCAAQTIPLLRGA
jgi:hypothetical protein